MAKSFRAFEGKMSEDSLRRSEEIYKELLNSLPLAGLRASRGLTQADMADRMGISQAAVSKLEARNDFLLSTAARYIAATGGRLAVNVLYPDASFRMVDADESGFELAKSREEAGSERREIQRA